MTLRYTWIEFLRQLRNPGVLIFTLLLPGTMTVIFGTAFDYGSAPSGHGNVNMYIMLGMAAYGAMMATNGIGGQAALEQMQGWGRQLALTPTPAWAVIATKAVVAMVFAFGTVLVIFGLGVLIDAEAPWWVWLQSGLIVWLGSGIFALFGLALGLLFRSEAAMGISAGGLVLLGFLGNMFMPLSGFMLSVARWTPLYGYVALARWPLIEGRDPSGEHDPLWQLILNMGLWGLLFAVVAVWGVVRSRERQ
ncbi:ABC transporter permease [Enemella sp. A6]|uniref:ABC transporter permease n=1 Tax=Enemella sp. A6 TaxID=3440152 RepID=UPI003EBFC492